LVVTVTALQTAYFHMKRWKAGQVTVWQTTYLHMRRWKVQMARRALDIKRGVHRRWRRRGRQGM
jgi:hypothetical protein